MAAKLDHVFRLSRKKWGGNGSGSSPEKTAALPAAIWSLIADYEIASILDFGCGEISWMKPFATTAEIIYTGVDVVPEVIEANRALGLNASFAVLDEDLILPACDLVLCRDVLAHLSNATAIETLRRLKESGSRWLLTTHRATASNRDALNGGFRPLNLCKMPFNFPAPRLVIPEGHESKELALWSFDKLSI
jgi:2-polyprenyl-3-methyl-5-hydroxy-6-metoxy-1,4-benzoquinol methylase